MQGDDTGYREEKRNMSTRKRVYELAKELGKTNAEIIRNLTENGFSDIKAVSGVPEKEAERLRKKFGPKKQMKMSFPSVTGYGATGCTGQEARSLRAN